MANAKIIYPSGAPTPTVYILPKNFNYGHQSGYLNKENYRRFFNGVIHSYSLPVKKIFELQFSYIFKAQMDYLTDLWIADYELDLYLNGINFDGTFKIMEPPGQWSEPVWNNGSLTYSCNLILQEV